MAKKYLDENGLLYFWQKIGNKFVAKETGKGLSTNDLTDALKQTYDDTVTTVAGIVAEGGEPNVIEIVKVNGTALTPDSNKAVDVTVPTNNNQLTNGAGYQNASQVQTAINSAIAGITGIEFEVVQSLPATGETGVIYLLSNSGSGQNIYDEYIWVNNAFEKIGTTAVDLSNYVQFSDLVAITNAEIDTIVAS